MAVAIYNGKKSTIGFTLIEVMITVAIVGILAAIAYPSYTSYVAKSNRGEGQRELLRIANLQEQYYVDNRTYTSDLTKLGLDKSPFITEHGHYSIAATVPAGGATFTLTATAKGTQASADSACSPMKVTDTGEKTPDDSCWEK